ncbi:MAG: hypothetical protein LM564_04250, partial [Desulfurococcaceae archaeon]|nr:hypothetical protein [Desulfurococcaceae archaeon]
FNSIDQIRRDEYNPETGTIAVYLSILSIRFVLLSRVADPPEERSFQFYRSDSTPWGYGGLLSHLYPLSILSIRFRAFNPPSLSIRFRL